MNWKSAGIDSRIGRLARGGAVITVLTLLLGGIIGPRSTSFPPRHFSDRAPVPATRCVDCHADQVHSLATAPHSLTLRPATADDVRQALLGLSHVHPETNDVRDRFELFEDRLVRRNFACGVDVPIDWLFGSGRHARTPVTTRLTPRETLEVLEHDISWYPGDVIDLTLGNGTASEQQSGGHILGTFLTPEASGDCFGCHATWLPYADGRPDLTRMIPGVGCARCHHELEDHLDAVASQRQPLARDRWSELSPLEAIRRCGECHRRDDQLTVDELRPDNLLLVRFAPVGLSQSRCFTAQSEHPENGRLDCVTCHDPHRPAETDPAFYERKCAACHSTDKPNATLCKEGRQAEGCLRCHMPPVEIHPRLKFTDHWIRRRTDGVP